MTEERQHTKPRIVRELEKVEPWDGDRPEYIGRIRVCRDIHHWIGEVWYWKGDYYMRWNVKGGKWCWNIKVSDRWDWYRMVRRYAELSSAGLSDNKAWRPWKAKEVDA